MPTQPHSPDAPAPTGGNATVPAAAAANGVPTPLAAHVFAAPAAATAAPQGGVAGIGQITLSLCIVLAAIFAFAWVARRMRGFGLNVRALDIIADVRLGPKERAVVLQVGGQQLLIGVAPGRVNTLHVLPEPLPPARPAGAAAGKLPDFAEALRRSLGK